MPATGAISIHSERAATPDDIPIFDNWLPLSFKRAMGSRAVPGLSWTAPTWVGDHARRLTAYTIYQAYYDNAARYFLFSDYTPRVAEDHREYGDAITLRDTILAAVLGEDQQIVCDGSDLDPDDEDLESEDRTKAANAHALVDWFDNWATNLERFGLKMMECERNAVGMGDGVYVLGYSPEKKRVRLRVFDPGFYFPTLVDDNEDDYPDRVHIAWELVPEAEDKYQRVRRITWERVPLTDERVANKSASRKYQSDSVTHTVLMTDATWTLDRNRTVTPDDFSENTAVYEDYPNGDGTTRDWKDIDLQIDFIPVVHIPNTVALANHYGKASIERILQILDDLSNADTDLQAASATTGKPPVALSSASPNTTQPTWNAGDLWTLGENGRATMIDTSKSLDALIKYVEFLHVRKDTNSRVPAVATGRIDHGDVKSGIHLALAYGPMRSLIGEMRLVRDEKYPILLRMLWRMSIQYDVADTPKEWLAARVQFGNYMPQDIAAGVELILSMFKAKTISRMTAIRLLTALGVDIEDATAEVEAIEHEDFEGAVQLAEALASEDAAADYLGRELQSPPPPPGAPPIPPPPGVPTNGNVQPAVPEPEPEPA